MRSPKILLTAHNIRPKKTMGQCFLADPNTASMILRRAKILAHDVVLEFGAGLGALTIPLAHNAKQVYAVEKDHQIIAILKAEILANNLANVVLVENDMLRFDIQLLAQKLQHKIILMGNLPYNISSQVLVQLVKSRKAVSRAILMLQKEVAQRLTAQPGCKEYGRLTVMLRYCSNIAKLADISASLFFPKPKIDSQILEFTFKDYPEYPANDETFLFRVIKAAFGNRRKTLKNALAASALNIDAKTAEQLLKQSGIDPMRRAETLHVAEFVQLSNNLIEVDLD